MLLQDFGYNNFSFDDEAPTPRLVIANVGNENYSKRAFMHAHSPLQDTFDSISMDVPKRPSTAGSAAGRERKLSVFSRPLTSYEYETRKRDSSRPNTASGPPRWEAGVSGSKQVGGIGVALGSPTSLNNQESSTLDSTVRMPMYSARNDSVKTLHTFSPATRQETPEQRPKPKRWKSVSNLFSRKKSTPSQIPPAATPESQSPYPESISDQSEKSGKWHTRGRSRSGSKNSISLRRSKPKMEDLPPLPAMPVLLPPTRPAPERPELAHSQTAPAMVESQFHPKVETAKVEIDPEPPVEPLRKRDSRPQLDVEIPQTRFERFSVMFSDLQGLNTMSKAQARTSLLARRNRTSRLVPLETLTQEAMPEDENESSQPEAGSLRPQTAPAAESKPSESVADVPLIAPTPRRAASTKSINKGPAYSLFPRTCTKTPRPSVTIPNGEPLPLLSNPNPLHRSLTTVGYVSPPPTCPPPALPSIAPKIEVSNEIDDMIDFLESTSSEAASPPTRSQVTDARQAYAMPTSALLVVSPDNVSRATTPPDSPVLKPLVYNPPHSNASTPRQPQHSPALPSSSIHQQTLVLPPSPVSSVSSSASSPTGTAPSTAGTAPSEQDTYHTPQISSSTSSSQHAETQDRPRATSLRRGGRDVAIVAPNAYVLNPPLSHSAANSRTSTSSPAVSPPQTAMPKRTSSLSPQSTALGTSPRPQFTPNTTVSNLSLLTAQSTQASHYVADLQSLSATSLSPAPSSAQTPSLAYGYDAEHSPLIAVAQTVSVVMGGSSAKPAGPARHGDKKSRIPVPVSSPKPQPDEKVTYLDDCSDIEPSHSHSHSHSLSISSSDFSDDEEEEQRSEDDIGRKSNEGIVRARTPTFVEVDSGEGGVIGLGLSTRGERDVAMGAGKEAGKSSGSLRRGRSVEGLLEVA